MQAAILRVKLRHLDNEIAARRTVAKAYIEHIDNPNIILPHWQNEESHVFHLFVIRTKTRGELQQYLSENDIQTLIHYPVPPHKQQAYKEWNAQSYPITEAIHTEVLSLPMGPTLSNDEATAVAASCNSFNISSK